MFGLAREKMHQEMLHDGGKTKTGRWPYKLVKSLGAEFPDLVQTRDEDPVLAKNMIRGPVPQTKGEF